MIQFIGVSKIYNASPEPINALNNISFEIQKGEFIFLVGSSGSGKTTIIRQLIREESPSQGKIFFEDKDITKLKRNDVYKLRRKIGIIFQDFKLIEEKNAYENIAFAMEAAGQSKKEILETVPYVLDIVNLAHREKAFPKELSGGEKQRVAIARAIANNPSLLIADEPTGNLDPDSAWDIVQILAKINKWGTTVIMSTHGEEIVNSLQKRVIKLKAGKLVRDDKKGFYEEVDEFSLKVMMKNEESENNKNNNQTPKSILNNKEKDKDKIKSNKDSNKSKNEIKEKKKLDNDETITVITIESDESNNSKKSDKNINSNDSDKAEYDNPDKHNNQTKNKNIKKTNNKKLKEVKDKKNKGNTKKIKNKTKQKKKIKIKEKLEKADESDIKFLKLHKSLEAKLINLGYKDVEDILKAGVAQVNKKLSKKEVKQLAKSIKKFLTSE